jgi:hypothetical protein
MLWCVFVTFDKRKDIFLMVLHSTLIRAPDSSKNSKYGAAGAPDRGIVHLQNFTAKTAFA